VEEDELERKAEEAGEMNEDSDLDEEEKELAEKIKLKRKMIVQTRILNKSNNKPVLPRKFKVRNMTEFDKQLTSLGLDTTKLKAAAKPRKRRERAADTDMEVVPADDDGGNNKFTTAHGEDDDDDRPKSKAAKRVGRSRTRSEAASRENSADPSVAGLSSRAASRAASRNRSKSRGPGAKDRERSLSRPKDEHSYKDPKQKVAAGDLAKVVQRTRNLNARAGEGDRRFMDKKPKHLFSGKMSSGTRDRR